MPPKETKEQRETRLKAARKKLSRRSRERRYNTRLFENYTNSQAGIGAENFKLSKQVIAENADAFKSKYLDENSDFQKRLAYLQTSLSKEEYEKSPEYKLSEIAKELIDEGIKEYSDYASINEVYESRNVNGKEVKIFASPAKRKAETAHLTKAREHFNNAEKKIDTIFKENPEYSSSEAFQNFYSDLKDLKNESGRIVSGGLTVKPHNGNNIIHVRLTEQVETTDPETNEKVVREVIREPGLLPVEKNTKSLDKSKPAEYYDIKYVSAEDQPLFSHEPCSADIQQGCIGDCYFIATLSSVADNNPDFIRNCMKDNGDGTVTVRLSDFEENNEVYTTIKKTVPMINVGKNGNEEWIPAYENGPLWVSMLVKALVQSGIVYNASLAFSNNITIGYENGEQVDRNRFHEIVGGRTEVATVNILGDNISQYTKEDMEIRMPKPGREKTPYTEGEIEFFNTVEAAYNNGDTVTAGINRVSTKKQDDKYKKFNGLPPGHAYSVIGVETDPVSSKRFIKVLNPHRRGGRTYNENDNPVYDPNPEMPGESRIELRDFVKTFSDCYAATYNASFFQEREAKLADDDRTMYKDAVLQACEEIIGTDHAFVWTNSDQFVNLKKAAIALKAEFKKDDSTHKEMDDKLKDFFKAAREYKNDRDTRKDQSLAKDSRDRSVKRYRLVDAVGRFEEIYNANREKDAELQYVDFDECKELVLDADMEKAYAGASQAKRATVDGLVNKKDSLQADAESAKKRIKAVEDQGLAKIENGLKNYNTKDLMEGLCEVLASRSAKAHQDELKPQEIQRSLSPECISRVRDHFEKKLESALKSIDKDEFMDIMSSDNIGERMAEKVNKNLVENENHPAPDKRIEDKKIAARQLESKKKSVLPS